MGDGELLKRQFSTDFIYDICQLLDAYISTKSLPKSTKVNRVPNISERRSDLYSTFHVNIVVMYLLDQSQLTSGAAIRLGNKDPKARSAALSHKERAYHWQGIPAFLTELIPLAFLTHVFVIRWELVLACIVLAAVVGQWAHRTCQMRGSTTRSGVISAELDTSTQLLTQPTLLPSSAGLKDGSTSATIYMEEIHSACWKETEYQQLGRCVTFGIYCCWNKYGAKVCTGYSYVARKRCGAGV